MLAAECSAGQRHTPRTHAYHARARVCTCCMGAPRCAGARCRTTAGTTLGRARSGCCIQHAGGCVAVQTPSVLVTYLPTCGMHTYLPTRDMPVPITCPVRSGNGAKRKATVTINHYINVCYDKHIVASPEIIQRNMKAANRSKCVHGYALPTHFKLPAV